MLSIQVKQPKRTLQLWFSIAGISFSVEVSILSKYLYTVGTIRSNRLLCIDSGNIHSHFNRVMLSIQVKQPKRTLQLWFSIAGISFSVEVSILSKYLYTVGTIRSNRRFGIDSGNIHSHFNKMIILKLQPMSSLMTIQFQVLNQTEVYLQIYQALLVNRLETYGKIEVFSLQEG